MCDELFPVVRMPPRKSTPLVCMTPERLAALEAKIKELLTEIDRLEDRLEELSEHPLPGVPHEGPNSCPTWYDYCRCSVENLEFNIKRAEKAGAEVERLRTACKDALFTIAALESGNLTDWAAHYTMVTSACKMLRAVLKKEGDEDE